MPRLTPDEIVAAHGVFGPVELLVARRRALYSAAVEVAAGSDVSAAVHAEVLDDPVVRAHLGTVLAGTGQFDFQRMRRTEAVSLPAAGAQW